MRINGEWRHCDDGIVRPIVNAKITASDGGPREVEFLVDTGADRTVISASALNRLKLPGRASADQIGGVGGLVDSVIVSAELRLLRDDGQWVAFRGEYAACTDYNMLDMSVLGRDILNMFALIVDRRGNLVAIIGQAHTYTINRQ